MPKSITQLRLQLLLHHLVCLTVGDAVHFPLFSFSLQAVELLRAVGLGKPQQTESVCDDV
jgi:hypothetical protein